MGLDGNLRARLQNQMSRESETLQTATQEQLNAMRSELKAIYSGALTTIESDTHQETKRLAKWFRRLMLLPSLLLVMISLGISVGAWAFTQYQWGQIQEQRQTLNSMETLGVEPLRQSDGKEFLLLPDGATLSELRQTSSGQNYVQLTR